MSFHLTRRARYGRICVVRMLGVLSFIRDKSLQTSHNLIVLCGLRATLRTPEHPNKILARRVALWL